jgi:hypothetical protein
VFGRLPALLMAMRRGRASSRFGRVIVSMPCSNWADAFSVSTMPGSEMLREKEP